MKSKIKIYIVLSTALVTLVLFGCTRRDLEMRLGKGYLKINLHWKQPKVPPPDMKGGYPKKVIM